MVDSSEDIHEWQDVLAHRADLEIDSVGERFGRFGMTMSTVLKALADAGDSIVDCVDADRSHAETVQLILLTAEIQAWASAVNQRAGAMRARFVKQALEGHSLSEVAEEVGTTKQAVFKASKNFGDIYPPRLTPRIERAGESS